MFSLITALIVQLHQAFTDRRDLLLENAALRQQLAIYQRRDSKPKLTTADRLFWVWLSHFWQRWRSARCDPAVSHPAEEQIDVRCQESLNRRAVLKWRSVSRYDCTVLSVLPSTSQAFRYKGTSASSSIRCNLPLIRGRTHHSDAAPSQRLKHLLRLT